MSEKLILILVDIWWCVKIYMYLCIYIYMQGLKENHYYHAHFKKLISDVGRSVR